MEKPATARLTDPRDQALDQAEELMQRIFYCRLAILRREAAAEAQIAEIREQVRLDTAQATAALHLHEARLSALILAHADEFERPRNRTCCWGTYGLRTSTRLEIADEEALLAWARENGYDDVIRIAETVARDAVKRRINAGETVPGANLVRAEASEYKLDPALLEAEM